MIATTPKNTGHSSFDYDFQKLIIPEKSDFMNNKQKSNKIEMKVHFWELPDTIKIRLNSVYSKKLFSRLLIKFNSKLISKKLGVSRSHFYHLKNQRYSIKPSQLVKISMLLDEDLNVIEKNIEYINSTRGGVSRFKFPLVGDENLSSLIGHCFGDGSIFTKKPQFKFCNFNQYSLDEVESIIEKQFKSPNIGKTKTTIAYSSLIGEILHHFGAHRGHKLKLNVELPNWIKAGSDKIKSRFLRALFDDDGSVSSSGKNKNINLHQTVLCEYNSYSKDFLKSVAGMLKDFNIRVHGPYLSRTYSVDGKRRNVNYIIITDWKSMENFSNRINFYHSEKKENLKRVLDRKEYSKNFEEVKTNPKTQRY